MTVDEYLKRNLPFFHITPYSNLSSILKTGRLKAGKNGICVVRSFKTSIIDEIVCRQINTMDEKQFSIIKLLPQEKNITLEEICEDSVEERTAPLHNYILKPEISVDKNDIYIEQYTPKCMSDEQILDEEIVGLTGYIIPARPFIDDNLQKTIDEWS